MKACLLLLLFPWFLNAGFLSFQGAISGIQLYDYSGVVVNTSSQCYSLCNYYTWRGCNSWQFQIFVNGTKSCSLNTNDVVRSLNIQIVSTTYPVKNSTWGYGGCRQCAEQAICRFIDSNVTCKCLPGYVGGGDLVGSKANCSLPTKPNCDKNANVTAGSCVCNHGYHGDGLASGSGCSNVNFTNFAVNYDYYGNDIGLVYMPKSATNYECQQQCNLFLGCLTWVYDANNAICYLKGKVGNLTSNNGFVAGLGGCSLCVANSTCFQAGSFSCTCNPGFVGNGTSLCTYVPTTPAPTTPIPTTRIPTTAVPTTQIPTTVTPTTVTPTTVAPTTVTPTTQIPTTAIPTTQPPTTQPPTTQPPTTQPPTTQTPTTQPPTTQLPSTQPPTTQPPTTQPPTTQPPTTQLLTTQPPTTRTPTTRVVTTQVLTTSAPTTLIATTIQPTDPPLSCANISNACVSAGGLLQTDKTFNWTNVIVSGNLIVGSTVILSDSTILINGSLNLAPNGVLNVSSDGVAPAINSTSDVILNGSINVQIYGVDQLNFTSDGTYNYTVIVSDTGINGQFSNVSVNLETSSSSSGCNKKSYKSQTAYTAKSLNIVVTQTSSDTCGSSSKWQTWMYGVIGGAVGLIAIIVGVVLWVYKGRQKSERFTVDY